MIRLEWSSSFERTLKKWITKHPSDRNLIQSKLDKFIENPFAPELKNHKLSAPMTRSIDLKPLAYLASMLHELIQEAKRQSSRHLPAPILPRFPRS